jgi:hypothetical protein
VTGFAKKVANRERNSEQNLKQKHVHVLNFLDGGTNLFLSSKGLRRKTQANAGFS